jgi:hypothetical protein
VASEFPLTVQDDVDPHQFRAYGHDLSVESAARELVDHCLAAWRLTARAFRDTQDAGFDGSAMEARLNALGVTLLPPTPADDADITKNPYVTDITELLALRVLDQEMPELRIPFPRVLHKEATGLQHHGVDLLGFVVDDGTRALAAIEVMASVQDAHPPQTVRDHLKQLLEETLSERPPSRLIKDIAYVHDECDDAHDKDVLNAFIVAISEDSLERPVLAVAILVRPPDAFSEDDWGPFRDALDDFGSAPIPGQVVFLAIECSESFAALMDRVKDAAEGPGNDG